MFEITPEIIKKCQLFANLADSEIDALTVYLEPIQLQSGEILFHQGSPSDSAYILVSGHMSVSIIGSDEKPHIIGEVSRGESVGEMGLLSEELRSATVTTTRVSTLFKLSEEHFSALCHKYPDILMKLVQITTTRLRSTIEYISGYSFYSNIVIIPAHPEVQIDRFIDNLVFCLDETVNCRFIRTQELESLFKDETDYHAIANKLDKIERSADTLFYQIQSLETPWRAAILERADRAVFIVNASCPVTYSGHAKSLLASDSVLASVKKELVLTYPEKKTLYSGTGNWLAAGDFFRHHHTCLGDRQDFKRLLRFLTGKAVGLVLSGGGTKVMAQMGAVLALLEANIPIDFIGGTSAGATNAACIALSNSAKEYKDFSNELFCGLVKALREYTLPSISILSANSLDQVLKKIFQDICIEDLPIGFFCMSTDLFYSKPNIHKRGLLWKATRASMSLPGVFPPVLHESKMLVDGAVLNNLPTDVMHNHLDNAGKIIGIDISESVQGLQDYNFPSVINNKRILANKFKLLRKDKKLNAPSLLDIFITSMMVGSEQKSTDNLKLIDLYIKPDVSEFGILETKGVEELHKLGYDSAIEALKDWRKKLL